MAATLPTIFLSHGSPMLALDSGAPGKFWQQLGRELPLPDAVLAVSAHWTTETPTVSSTVTNATIHDFHGFPAPLYQISYPAPGAPDLAQRVTGLLKAAKIPVGIDPARGLDHGAWVPLRDMYPLANMKVAQLSVQPHQDAAWHVALGRALAPLAAENVLVLASGGAVHNLREMDREGGPTPAWAANFDDWLAKTLTAGNEADFIDWTRKA
ncbi:MAG TPA: class III extradiol ring-cleavage dioxygenase, partial [Stellaceae bacterium]|nr:class III extradiol ring-cleavage dioxygenase [Stellaceae bacterium]